MVDLSGYEDCEIEEGEEVDDDGLFRPLPEKCTEAATAQDLDTTLPRTRPTGRTDRRSSSTHLPTEVPTDRTEHVPTEGRMTDRGIHEFTYRAEIVMSSVG